MLIKWVWQSHLDLSNSFTTSNFSLIAKTTLFHFGLAAIDDANPLSNKRAVVETEATVELSMYFLTTATIL